MEAKKSRFSRRTREQLKKILNHAWREEVVLSAVLKKYLGENNGPSFQSFSRLFTDHYRQINAWLGELTERTRGLGAAAVAGKDEIVRAMRGVMGAEASRPTVSQLAELHEGIAGRLRDDLDDCREDASTADFLTRLVEFHEDTAWMLRTVLQGSEVPWEVR